MKSFTSCSPSFKTKGYTLVEVLVTLSIFSVLAAGILSSTLQIGRHIEKTRNLIKAKEEITAFHQAIYNFTNKSFGAYFWDSSAASELNYLTTYDSFNTPTADKSIYDTLFFVKNNAGTDIARLVYNPTNRTLSWFRGNGASEQVMLTEVYRTDYDGTNLATMNQPVFKFPHRSDLYTSPTRPNYVIIEFRKLVQAQDSNNPYPVTVPIKIMAQLNTIN